MKFLALDRIAHVYKQISIRANDPGAEKPVLTLIHDGSEVSNIEVTIFTQPAFSGVIGPLPGILEIVNIVAELREAENILKVIPSDTTQRILSDESCDDDA